MKTLLALLVILLLHLPTVSLSATLLPGGSGKVVGHYIVVLKSDQEPAAIARAHGAAAEHLYQHALRGFSATLPDVVLRRLLNDPGVEYIEPDGLVWAVGVKMAKPGRGGSVKGPAPQEIPWGIARVGGAVDASSLERTAWVIDTGVDPTHPDLNVDVDRAENFVTRGRYSTADGDGHGTHVAGTIAAIDNDIDVVGVAAGASVVGVRVLDNNGSGYYSWVIAGVDYVAANGKPGDVANMSLSGGGSSSLDNAVKNAASKGIFFTVAAGNDSSDATAYSPARVNHPNVYTVSAIDAADYFAWFSNYGDSASAGDPVDVAAPGVNILSTAKGGGTTTMSGTSMAAPHVAGLLLLNGVLSYDGAARSDPDGFPDPIVHY